MISVAIFLIIIVLFCIIHIVIFLSKVHNAVSTSEICGREHPSFIRKYMCLRHLCFETHVFANKHLCIASKVPVLWLKSL